MKKINFLNNFTFVVQKSLQKFLCQYSGSAFFKKPSLCIFLKFVFRLGLSAQGVLTSFNPRTSLESGQSILTVLLMQPTLISSDGVDFFLIWLI